MKHCQWCDSAFEPNVSYQIYCSPSCRTHATREKINERYLKQRLSKASYKQRKCKSCGASLSVYNDEKICGRCRIDPLEVSKTLKEIKRIADGKDKLA
jgi:ribosomal protein S27AE